jgi:CheY-like chemotaxis protein
MSSRPVILIADGMPNTIPEMDRILGALGYETSIARNVSSALSMADELEPAAAVLGLHLPGGGPLTALRQLRASAHGASTAIIVLAHPGPGKELLLAEGGDLCLDPPVRESDILAALKELLS